MKLFLLLLFSSVSLSFFAQPACSSERYKKQIFPSVTKTSQVYFGTADPYGAGTQPLDLYMDIYEPSGDTLTSRPLIVYAFGGAFLIGNKIQPPIPDYCEAFAKMGYVVAAIDYRIGFNILSTGSAIRAVYRAAQDLRASVRFLCQRNAQYRIDTASVILTGSSAGCFAGLHSTYFEESQRPPETFGIPLEQTDLGCFDCAGNSDFGKRMPTIRAIVNHWGALIDTLLIENEPDENCPVISFHGDGDALVPYGTGNPFSYPVFPNVFGSQPIHRRLNNLGIKNKFITLAGEGHEPWLLAPRLLDTAYKYTSVFLHEVMMPKPQQISGENFACKGETRTVQAINRDRSSYCWTLQGKGTIVSENGSEMTFVCNDTGLITITLIEKNYLDIFSEPITFKVNVLPKAEAEFSLATVNQLQVVINDLAKNFISKQWHWGDGASTSGNVVLYNYDIPGNYEITQIVSNAGCSDTFTQVVEVDTCPVAAFTYVVQGDSLILFAEPSNGQTFSWNVLGTTVTGQDAVVIVPTKSVVPVTLTVTNKIGCSKSAVQFVNTNVSGGVIDVDFSLKPLVFPNPFSDAFIIDLKQAVSGSYQVLNVWGSVVKSGRFIRTTRVDASDWVNGVYFLGITSGKKIFRERILKNQ